MRLSSSFFYTIREDIKDEDSISGNLLVKSGMIKKTSSGVYMYMPLGLKVINNIKTIIREEINKTGAIELLMPALVPEEIYEKTGRIKAFGKDIFKFNDRKKTPYVLGPTHEELFTIATKEKIKSYKDLPFNLYQIQNKYRDEIRPRYGLIRVREFIMKDAYSFDKDELGLDISYQKMFDSYKKIFDRMGLKYKVVEADVGAMGGILSEEFQAICDIGEDILVMCSTCDYATNYEIAEFSINDKKEDILRKYSEVKTPNMTSILDVSKFLEIPITSTVKSIVVNADNKLFLCLIRGDRELNFHKLSKVINANEINFANDIDMKNINTIEGFIGPININIPVIIDSMLLSMTNFITGSNKKNYHLIDVNMGDFTYQESADISKAKENDCCPKCNGKLIFKKGIEIGNTFKLGTNYSQYLNLNYLNEENILKPVFMGCYGIGIGRILASFIEQNHDDKGIIFSSLIAPYKVYIVIADMNNDVLVNYANNLYEELTLSGIDTIIDDRLERLGVKFNDADLIGIPFRVTIGKRFSEDLVELKLRNNEQILHIYKEEIITTIKEKMHDV